MKAIVLISGGLDSATALAIANHEGYQCYALSFDYNQRHIVELKAASKIAKIFAVKTHKIIKLDLPDNQTSALTNKDFVIPKQATTHIPLTYVPARNTIFLSYALAWAECLTAQHIFIGITAVDYSGYPDCRPEYIASYEKLANLATKASTEAGKTFKIHTPLIHLSKAEIIKKGVQLNIDYALTSSCYQATSLGIGCGGCDACRHRIEGFQQAGLKDPVQYPSGY